MLSFISLFLVLISFSRGLGDVLSPEAEEAERAGLEDAEILKCFDEMAHENDVITKLLDDSVFVNDLFVADFCSVINQLGIWNDIDVDQLATIEYIIEEHIFLDLAFYGIDESLIQRVQLLFRDPVDLTNNDFGDIVLLEYTLNAMKWLTQRKIEYVSLDIFCEFMKGGDISNKINNEMMYLLEKCVLFNPAPVTASAEEQELSVSLPNNIINKTRVICERLLSKSKAFTMEFTKQFSIFYAREHGHGIYGILNATTKLVNYTVKGRGGGLAIGASRHSINWYKYKPGYSGDNLMTADGKLVFGIELFLGFEYGIVYTDKFLGEVMANVFTIPISLGLGVQIPVWIHYDDDHGHNVTERIANFNLSRFCSYFTPSPTTGPTIQPQSGSIDLFGSKNKGYWTPIKGNWSNISTQTINPVLTNYDAYELGTTWIGKNNPSSLLWQNYSVSWGAKFFLNSVSGVSSVGIIFGTQSDSNEAIFVGIRQHNITFGTFDTDGRFSLISSRAQPAVIANSRQFLQFKAYFVVYNTTAVYVSLSFNAVSIMGTYINNAKFLLGGSVGFRTINMNGSYNGLTVTFNETYSKAKIGNSEIIDSILF